MAFVPAVVRRWLTGLGLLDENGDPVGGGGIAATVLDAKGDMLAASAADTAARVPAASVNGQVPTSDSALSAGVGFKYPPNYEFDYAEFTSNVSPTQTAEASADIVVTGGSVTYDGATIVVIEFYAPLIRPDTAAANRQLLLWLFDGSSSIGRLATFNTPAAQSDAKPCLVARRLTPSAAAHTYSIRATVSAGTGLIAVGAGGAGADMPGFMRITKA